MKRLSVLLSLLLLSLLLAACSSSPSAVTTEESTSEVAPEAEITEGAVPSEAASSANEAAPANLPAESGSAETRIDEQGAVVVSVTPLNLSTPGATLDFEVSLETHSVDLSMNLVELAAPDDR